MLLDQTRGAANGVKDPAVSAIIVNWNHGHLLEDCLDALLAQAYSSLDVNVVDNASQDGSREWIVRRYPTVRLWALPDNLGFSCALNWGIGHTEGDLLLSLNPDTIVRRDFVWEMVRAIRPGWAGRTETSSILSSSIRTARRMWGSAAK